MPEANVGYQIEAINDYHLSFSKVTSVMLIGGDKSCTMCAIDCGVLN